MKIREALKKIMPKNHGLIELNKTISSKNAKMYGQNAENLIHWLLMEGDDVNKMHCLTEILRATDWEVDK